MQEVPSDLTTFSQVFIFQDGEDRFDEALNRDNGPRSTWTPHEASSKRLDVRVAGRQEQQQAQGFIPDVVNGRALQHMHQMAQRPGICQDSGVHRVW